MILRDPVHGLVAFEGLAERIVCGLLSTREMQRLRQVRQLGFTSLVFPGAEHSRFAHSLGTAHIMVRLLERLAAVQQGLPADSQLDPEAEADAIAAALLHDLGHGPFSHLWEELLPAAPSHEQWTEDMLLDPSADVYRVLRAESQGMPERVASMVRGEHRLGYLARAVSGALDVDRFDYLLRDSHMTGVSYGIYDLDWLLRSLTLAELSLGDERKWVLAVEGRKGLPPMEGFFLARQFMYQQVYHHKATRAADVLMRAILLRLATLVRDGRAPADTPAGIVRAVRGEPVSVGVYFELDDARMLSCMRMWERGADPTLRDLTQRLFSRRLPKSLPLPAGNAAAGVRHEALSRAQEITAAAGFDTDLHVWLDMPVDIPYRESADSAADGLWVQLKHHPLQRLGEISFLLGNLRNKRIERPRLLFPPEVRAAVEAAIADLSLPEDDRFSMAEGM